MNKVSTKIHHTLQFYYGKATSAVEAHKKLGSLWLRLVIGKKPPKDAFIAFVLEI